MHLWNSWASTSSSLSSLNLIPRFRSLFSAPLLISPAHMVCLLSLLPHIRFLPINLQIQIFKSNSHILDVVRRVLWSKGCVQKLADFLMTCRDREILRRACLAMINVSLNCMFYSIFFLFFVSFPFSSPLRIIFNPVKSRFIIINPNLSQYSYIFLPFISFLFFSFQLQSMRRS